MPHHRRKCPVIALAAFAVLAAGCGSAPYTVLARSPKLDMAGYALNGDATVVITTSVTKNLAKSGARAYETTSSVRVIERTGKDTTYSIPGNTDTRWWDAPDTLVTNPGGTNLLYRRSEAGQRISCAIDLRTGASRALFRTRDRLKNAMFSGDGSQVAILTQSDDLTLNGVAIIDPATAERHTLWMQDGTLKGLAQMAGWTDSGQGIVLSSEYTAPGKAKDYRLFVLPATGGRPKETHRFRDANDVYGPLLLDGNEIIYCTPNGVIRSVRLGGKRERTVSSPPKGTRFLAPMVSRSRRYLSASISDRQTGETGLYVIDRQAGKSAAVRARESASNAGSAIHVLEWHPTKDKLLAVHYERGSGYELREYDAAEMLAAR